MKKLLKIETLKAFHNTTFRVILILHFLLFFLLIYVVTKIDITVPGFDTKNLFIFPNVWGLFTWFASWFNLLFLGTLLIILTGNEFNFKTSRLQIMNGLSRNEFFYGKGLMIVLIALWSMILVFLAGLVIGMIFTPNLSFHSFLSNSYFLLVYFIQAIGYMAFALMIVSVFRSNALSIMMYLLYFIMIEPIVRVFFPKLIRSYFPVKVISGLTPIPEFLSLTSKTELAGSNGKSQLDFDSIGLKAHSLHLSTSIILALVYTGLFLLISFWIIRKRDL